MMAVSNIKLRVDRFTASRPATCCFILSLFLIAIAMVSLGVYVRKKKQIPDLDAMKNWNAYIGRLGYNDFCFNHVSSTITTNNISCKDTDQNNTEYGTVDIGLNFYLHQNMVNMSGLFYTTFHGSDVGAKIKDFSGKRIDSEIKIQIILSSDSLTRDCLNLYCEVEACLLVTAPLSSIPTRMPQIHRDFSFQTKVFNSNIDRRPKSCECNFNRTDAIHHLLMLPDHNCKGHQSLLKTSTRRTKYGIINIELSESDRLKSSKHMFLASLMLCLLAVSVIIVLIFK